MNDTANSYLKQDQPRELAAWLAGRRAGGPVHLVGAGGCGMSALGHVLLDLGFTITGSDLAASVETAQLEERGAVIAQGHSAGAVQAAQPILVVFSSAIRPDNSELAAARALAVPVVRRGELLAALATAGQAVCVAGMHGKTTTTALLAFALGNLGARPGYAVGSLVPQLAPHGKAAPAGGSAPAWFILETDESDGTLTAYHPAHAILLNVDEDHLDHFGSFDRIGREFQTFASQVRGTVFYSADDPRLGPLLAGQPRKISWGFQPADYQVIQQATGGGGSEFELSHGGQSLGRFGIRLIGRSNVSNAAAVVAVLHQLGFAPEAIAEAIRDFQGAARRQQELYRDESVQVFEDYGHHPQEIQATLEAFKASRPGRLLVAFQPHRHTRTRDLLDRFATCFGPADGLWVTDIYAAGEEPLPGVTGEALARAVAATGRPVSYIPTLPALAEAVSQVVRPGDVVLFLGAGDITQAAHQLAAQLRARRLAGAGTIGGQLSRLVSPGTVIRGGEPLAKKTTWRVGGRADWYVEPATEDDLAALLQFCAGRELPVLVLGRGSNLLVQDGGWRGLVVCLNGPLWSRIAVEGERLRAGAGARLREVVMTARRHGLGGLEFLEGIPGSVGGALRMNAGAMGASLFQVLEQVRAMDYSGRVGERAAGRIPVAYRSCAWFQDHIALEAVLRAVPAPVEQIDEILRGHHQRRWRTQPAAPSAGCVFKNPEGSSAGRLIDELGLKGLRVGGARVSEVHANFIINEGRAAARDVLQLIEQIRGRVRAERGIELELEIKIVGEPE